jgi:hypothetical protein
LVCIIAALILVIWMVLQQQYYKGVGQLIDLGGLRQKL